MDKIIDEFISIVTSNHRVISTRLNEKYFAKINKVDLWSVFNELTANLDCSIGDRLIFINAGYIDERPKCIVCGRPVNIVDRKVSRYCCAACAKKDTNRATKISQTKRSQDHSIANEKRRKTMLEKYGVETNSQRQDIKHVWTKTKLEQEIHNKLDDRNWLYDQYVTQNKSALQIGKEIGCYYGTVLAYCRKYQFKIIQHYNTSIIEKEVCQFLEEVGIQYFSNQVGLYDDNREVDIWIPSHCLAIEIDGLRWHNELYRERLYHRNKTEQIKSPNKLIHFTDKQWNEQNEICKSIIKNKLGLSTKLYGRKMSIECHYHVNDEIRALFDQNHIDGFCAGSLYIVLKDDASAIVCGAVFGSSRFGSGDELIRFVTIKDHIVIGGMSKILNKYRQLRPTAELTSYVNKALFDGSSYTNDNWTRLDDSDVGYCWTNGNETISRYKARRSCLKKWLPQFDDNKSENENMTANGWYRMFDCGNMVFKYNR